MGVISLIIFSFGVISLFLFTISRMFFKPLWLFRSALSYATIPLANMSKFPASSLSFRTLHCQLAIVQTFFLLL